MNSGSWNGRIGNWRLPRQFLLDASTRRVQQRKRLVFVTQVGEMIKRRHTVLFCCRTAQAFELSQFVRHTAHGADAIIVVGDFNLEPVDLGYRWAYYKLSHLITLSIGTNFRIILAQAKLLDAWRLSHEAEYSDADMGLGRCRGVGRGGTSDRPDNSYSSILKQRTVRVYSLFFTLYYPLCF